MMGIEDLKSSTENLCAYSHTMQRELREEAEIARPTYEASVRELKQEESSLRSKKYRKSNEIRADFRNVSGTMSHTIADILFDNNPGNNFLGPILSGLHNADGTMDLNSFANLCLNTAGAPQVWDQFCTDINTLCIRKEVNEEQFKQRQDIIEEDLLNLPNRAIFDPEHPYAQLRSRSIVLNNNLQLLDTYLEQYLNFGTGGSEVDNSISVLEGKITGYATERDDASQDKNYSLWSELSKKVGAANREIKELRKMQFSSENIVRTAGKRVASRYYQLDKACSREKMHTEIIDDATFILEHESANGEDKVFAEQVLSFMENRDLFPAVVR